MPLTRDQSYVGRLVEQGIIRPEDAVTHPQRNILTGALGAGSEVVPEVLEQPITTGKRRRAGPVHRRSVELESAKKKSNPHFPRT